LFDHLNIEIKAETVEFRRSINLHFRGHLNINAMKGTQKTHSSKKEEADSLSMQQAIKPKSKKSKVKK